MSMMPSPTPMGPPPPPGPMGMMGGPPPMAAPGIGASPSTNPDQLALLMTSALQAAQQADQAALAAQQQAAEQAAAFKLVELLAQAPNPAAMGAMTLPGEPVAPVSPDGPAF